MNKNDIAFRKMALLMEAMQEIEQEDKVLEKLKSVAFEALLLHPGSGYREWSTILVEQYTMEVYDVFGEDEDDIRPSLAKLWMEDYQDIASGQTYTYRDWSKAFATPEAAQFYKDMVRKTHSNTNDSE
ncbi:MAG: hypothetical protein IJU19_00595 [Bacteroidales bacterium]|nr:hypothetical protein [Bacteroidales bacterium]